MHDFAFACRQGIISFAKRQDCQILFPSVSIALDSHSHGVKEFLFADGLGQELDGTPLYGFDGHRNIAMPSDENDRKRVVQTRKRALKIEAAWC